MAIPTADLRARLDLPTIKPSPKDGFKRDSGAKPRADSETGRGFAGGAPASSDTGAAVDSPAGLLEHRKAIQQGILKYFARNERLDAYRETGERQSTRSTG